MGEQQQELSLEQVINTVSNKPHVLTLENGAEVEVYKVKMRHLSFMVGFVNRLVTELGVDENGNVSVDFKSQNDILKLISKLPNEVADAVVLLTSLTDDTYADLDMDQGLEVVGKVVEVNRVFFTEKVLPKFKSLMAGVMKANDETAP